MHDNTGSNTHRIRGFHATKVMWNSAHVMDIVKEAKNFGVEASVGEFDWPTLKKARDAYITRLNGIYERNLGNSGVHIIEGVSAHAVAHMNAVHEDGSGVLATKTTRGWHIALERCYVGSQFYSKMTKRSPV